MNEKQLDVVGRILSNRSMELDYTEYGKILEESFTKEQELERKAQQLAQKIHLDLIELASMADEEEKILYVNIQCDRMCPTGNVGANVVTEFEISIEEI